MTMFKIKRLDARIVSHQLRSDNIIISHAGRHDTSRYLIVTIYDDDGFCGYGESATVSSWSGETAETSQWMVENLFSPMLVGHTFNHPEECLARLDEIAYGNSFTKSAVDTAVWDMWARRQNVPVSKLIANRELPESVPTRASIGAYPTKTTLELAKRHWLLGVRTLKFKVGLPGTDDFARLRAVRDELGNEPIFTIDANGAYKSFSEAVRCIEALLPIGISLVEQPTPRDQINMLAEVRKRVCVPVMADECIFTKGHLIEALDCDAFDVVSIYPGKNGGFGRAIEMACLAQQAGKRCAIGSNGETELGQAAQITIAASLSAFPIETEPCDLQAALMYETSSLSKPMDFIGGRILVPSGIGFGVVPLGQTVKNDIPVGIA